MHTPDEPQAQELDALMQDKVETHCRQQLSAMLDGALAPDQAKFLLRRLQHDHELAGCWERWQLCGDLMRGSAPALLPADFAQRVSAALTAEAMAPVVAQAAAAADASARAGWRRWSAPAALAASVAAVALLVAQRAPDAARPDAGQAPAVAQSTPAAPAAFTTDSSVVPATPTASTAAAAAGLLAAAEGPRRAAARRNRTAPARTEVARVAPRQDVPTQDRSTPIAHTAAAQVRAPLLAEQTPVPDPLLGEVSPVARPWPRAVLPGLGQGAFNVDLSAGDGGPATFEGFEPQLPVVQAEPDPLTRSP